MKYSIYINLAMNPLLEAIQVLNSSLELGIM